MYFLQNRYQQDRNLPLTFVTPKRKHKINSVVPSCMYDNAVIVVVVLFYIHGQAKVMPGRSVNLTTLFLGRLRSLKWLTSTSCTYFRQ